MINMYNKDCHTYVQTFNFKLTASIHYRFHSPLDLLLSVTEPVSGSTFVTVQHQTLLLQHLDLLQFSLIGLELLSLLKKKPFLR